MDPVRSKTFVKSADSQPANRTSNRMDGFLLVDKSVGWTSFDVVAKVRSTLQKDLGSKIKVGHTGTLDPAASGVLILVIGDYTKKAKSFSKLDKTYKVKVTLGAVSTTGDGEGEIKYKSKTQPSPARVEEVLKQFQGSYAQTPPAFSAVKVGGQRAYSLARKGKLVALESRTITIHSIQLVRYRYPNLWLIVRVSSGTYIRSLAEDIGKSLGCGAYVSALRRLKIGKFYIKNAITLDRLTLTLLKHHLKQ